MGRVEAPVKICFLIITVFNIFCMVLLVYSPGYLIDSRAARTPSGKACNLSPWEVKERGPEIQGHSCLYSKFPASLDPPHMHTPKQKKNLKRNVYFGPLGPIPRRLRASIANHNGFILLSPMSTLDHRLSKRAEGFRERKLGDFQGLCLL